MVFLGLLYRNGSVSVDNCGHFLADGLYTKGQRADIEEQDQFHFFGALTAEDGSLDSGTVRDGRIGIEALVEGFAAEELGQHLLDIRNTGRAADEDDLADLVFSDFITALTAVLQHLLDTGHALLEDVLAELFELGTMQDVFVVLTIGENLNLDLSRVSS